MKIKNVLAALLAAAVLCGTAVPVWAETADEKSPQYSVAAPETTIFAVQDAIAVQDAPAENMATINGTHLALDTESTNYYKTEADTLVAATMDDYTVKVEATADGCHVTLNNAAFANPAATPGYVAVYASRNLQLTLLGSNTLPGPVVAGGKLTIDGTGKAQITVDETSNMGCMLSGVNGAEIGGNVTITAQNNAAYGVTGLYTRTGDAVIRDSANVSLYGNMENGVLNMQSSLRIRGGRLYINGARVQDNEYHSGGNGVSAYGDVTVDGGTLEITNIDGDGIMAGSGKSDAAMTGITGGMTINGGTVKISDVRGLTIENNIRGGRGISVYNDVTVNAGTLEISNIGGNGIDLGHGINTEKCGDFIVNSGMVKISDVRRIPYGEYGFGGKGVSTAADIKINGGTVMAENIGVNDLFSNGDIIIRGGNLQLNNSSSALVSYNNVVIEDGIINISEENFGVSVYQGNITINGGSVTAYTTDDTINSTLGDVNITGGTVTVSSAEKTAISVYQGYSDDYKGTIRITGGKVKADAAQNAMQAFSGGIVFGGNALVDAHSKDWVTLGSGDVTVDGNGCDIILRSDAKMAVGGWIKLTNADEMVALGGENEAEAVRIEREEKDGKMQMQPTDCKYLHIFKAKVRPADSVVVKADGWTQGGTPTLPAVTDAAGNDLNAKVYYRVKGADDASYTDAVPTAVGEYEVKLVVPAAGEYGESVYYGSFAIAAQPSQPAQTPQPTKPAGGSTTVTAAARPTTTPRAEAKAQSTPAVAVTAAIPQTADTFPYVELAVLMSVAGFGMMGVVALRKKRQ